MAQRVFWNWKDDDKTIDLMRWLTGMIPNGVYNGFEFSPTADLNFTFIHSGTGYRYTKPDYTNSDFIGTLMTRQGAIITEDESIIFPIDENTDDHDRIDTIYLSYLYEEVEGGTPGVYSYVKGTPSATPTAPVVPNSNTDLIIGYLFVPRHTSTLNASGVTFTKNKVPNFGWVPNTYNAVNYVHNGDTPHEAIAYLDAALKILYDKYETNTLLTPIAGSSLSASRYSKLFTIDMPSVADFYSAILAISGTGVYNSSGEPLFGLVEINISQTAAFGSNPVVYIKKLSGNLTGNFLIGKIVDNTSPSTVEVYLYGQGITNSGFAVRVVSANKATGTIVTYFQNQAWASISGTLKIPVAKKIFKRGADISWPDRMPASGISYLPVFVTPNDGKRRTFCFECDSGDNWGNTVNFNYLVTPSAYYTSFGSIVEEALVFGASYWNGTLNTQCMIFRATSGSFLNVDPGTTMYIKLSPGPNAVIGYFRIKNIREIDADEFDIS